MQGQFDPREKKILVITAHPDDADFCAGGTLLKWMAAGAKGAIVIATNGDKGTHDQSLSSSELIDLRKNEQLEASKFIGFEKTWFLDYPDVHLEVTQELKEKLVKVIREYQPNIVFTWDPNLVYSLERNMVNHPDHRAIGLAALDACFPMARDFLTFPEHQKEGLNPHCVSDLFLFNFDNPNYCEDITGFVDKKMDLLDCHGSQINREKMEKVVRSWCGKVGEKLGTKYAESFIHISLHKD